MTGERRDGALVGLVQLFQFVRAHRRKGDAGERGDFGTKAAGNAAQHALTKEVEAYTQQQPATEGRDQIQRDPRRCHLQGEANEGVEDNAGSDSDAKRAIADVSHLLPLSLECTQHSAVSLL